MFIILRNRFLKPQHSLAPNLLLLQTKTLITPFCSLQSSESKPNSTSEQIISLFRSHGFTETQISKLTQVRPMILSANADKTIAPKLDFLLSIGIPKSHLPRLVCNSPALLWTSVQNQLIPCHNFLKKLLGSDENVAKMLLHKSRILGYDVDKIIAPNINLLTQIGVPKSVIFFMLFRFSNVACKKPPDFKRIVEEAIQMGFNPTKTAFAKALLVFCAMTKTTLDRKWKVYKSWGLSDDEVGIIFRSHPLCMCLSEEKITKGMDIFVNEMGREAAEVARTSHVLFYNLENRVKPRCKVIKVLISEGVLKKSIALGTFLTITEAQFLERFVSKYKNIVPGLLSVYQESLPIPKCGLES